MIRKFKLNGSVKITDYADAEIYIHAFSFTIR